MKTRILLSALFILVLSSAWSQTIQRTFEDMGYRDQSIFGISGSITYFVKVKPDDDMDQMGVSDRAYNRICNRRDELELAFKATSKDSRKDRFSLSKTSTSPIDVRIENLRKELVKEGNSKARIDAINKAINALLDQKVSEESVAESSVTESSVADQIATLELALASATTAAAKKKIQDKIDAIAATV